MTSQAAIGTPVINPYGHTGFIAQVTPGRGGMFMIGAGGLAPIANDYEIVFPDRTTTLADSIVGPWIDRAARMGVEAATPDQLAEMRAAALQAQAEARAQQTRDRSDAEAARVAFQIEARANCPADAKAVIVAELIQDQSDSMNDYFGSTTRRTVILGFSSHTRDLFPELRKAALNFAETADLFEAPASAEHREKYSMGGGFYLKAKCRHDSGWKISKARLYQGADSIPSGEWSLAPAHVAAPAAKVPAAAAPAAGQGLAISQHKHDRKGFDMWIVTLPGRVEREEFDRLLSAAKSGGGWYSKKWGTSPAGFAFKREEAAKAFAGGSATAPEAIAESPRAAAPAAPKATANPAEKLRTMADGLQRDIDAKFADRLSNTPKRQREAANARLDGWRLKRTQQALRLIADHHDAGTLPGELRGVTTKAAVFDLVRADVDHSGGYYDAGRETGKPALSSPAALTLWAMLQGPSAAERAAAALAEKIGGLQFANIPGYFPTPGAIVDQMIDLAEIPDGATVLEPEAGSGAICDRVKAAVPSCRLVAFERHATLREILKAKGHDLAGSDFMESEPFKVARVLMNPPFENGQDMAHVMRAFGHLEEGGRLVAIMSPGPFFRSDAKAQAFRAWFDARGGEKIDLPAGAFKESGTGVSTVLVTIPA